MSDFWRNRKVSKFIALALACGAAVAVSIALTYPQSVSNEALGSQWQCHKAAILTSCTRVGHAEPSVLHSHQRSGTGDLRRV